MTLIKYRSVREAVRDLNRRGFTSVFNIYDGKIDDSHGRSYETDEISIVEIHRFNVQTPTVIFVLETNDNVNGYCLIPFEGFTDQKIIATLDKIRIRIN